MRPLIALLVTTILLAGCAAARETAADPVVAPIAAFAWFLDQLEPRTTRPQDYGTTGPVSGPVVSGPVVSGPVVPWSSGDSINIYIYRADGTRAGYSVQRSPGSVDLYDSQSRRLGYGVQRSDGSWDYYRADGSRLGSTSSSGRTVITPRR